MAAIGSIFCRQGCIINQASSDAGHFDFTVRCRFCGVDSLDESWLNGRPAAAIGSDLSCGLTGELSSALWRTRGAKGRVMATTSQINLTVGATAAQFTSVVVASLLAGLL